MRKEIKIGIVSFITLLVFIWGYQFLKGKNVFEGTSTYYIKYNNIDQLEVASPVLVNGYKVGSVVNIKMDPADYTKLIVSINVKNEIKIPKNTNALITSMGLVGGKGIILQISGPCSGDNCAKSGEYLQGGTLSMLSSMVPEGEIDSYFSKIKSGLMSIVDTLSVEGKNNESVLNTKRILKNLAEITNNLQSILAANQQTVNASLSNINQFSANLKANNKNISDILSKLSGVSGDLDNAEIDSLSAKAAKTVVNLNENLKELENVLKKTNTTFNNLNGIVTDVENGKGSLGKLMKNDELYDNINLTLKHSNLLLQDMRLYPGRYFNLSLFKSKKSQYVKPEFDPALQPDQK